MATKRRKVWLAQTVDGLSMYAMRTKADAKERAGKGGKSVPLIERLPGDVVLSREEVAELLRAWVKGENLRALLRGRR